MDHAHVIRTPVYDRSGRVAGYRLRWRGRSPAIEAALAGYDLGDVIDDQLNLVRLSRDFLGGTAPLPFHPAQAVVEVPAGLDEATVARLARGGYAIALNGADFRAGPDRLRDLASYLTLDLRDTALDHVSAVLDTVRQHGRVRVIATRLDTRGHLALARRLGCELFTGQALTRRWLGAAPTLSPLRLRCVELIATLSHGQTGLPLTVAVVAGDPFLSARLLRAVYGNDSGGSVSDVVGRFGAGAVRRWVSLMLIRTATDADDAQLAATLTRARLSQAVAEHLGVPGGPAFTAGMVANVAELVGVPVAELAQGLPLAPAVADGLTGRGGELADVLELVRAYTDADLAALRRTELPAAALAQAYLRAVRWTVATMDSVRMAFTPVAA